MGGSGRWCGSDRGRSCPVLVLPAWCQSAIRWPPCHRATVTVAATTRQEWPTTTPGRSAVRFGTLRPSTRPEGGTVCDRTSDVTVWHGSPRLEDSRFARLPWPVGHYAARNESRVLLWLSTVHWSVADPPTGASEIVPQQADRANVATQRVFCLSRAPRARRDARRRRRTRVPSGGYCRLPRSLLGNSSQACLAPFPRIREFLREFNFGRIPNLSCALQAHHHNTTAATTSSRSRSRSWSWSRS